MNSFDSDNNPWGNDASFDLAFGGLSRFLEEIGDHQLLPPKCSGYIQDGSFTDPFILRLTLADEVVANRRVGRRKALVKRLQAETSDLFTTKSDEIIHICESLQKTFLEFEEFDAACALLETSGKPVHRLSILPENQKKLVTLLDFALLVAQHNGSLESLQANAMNMTRNLINSVNDHLYNINAILSELERLESEQQAFNLHIQNSMADLTMNRRGLSGQEETTPSDNV